MNKIKVFLAFLIILFILFMLAIKVRAEDDCWTILEQTVEQQNNDLEEIEIYIDELIAERDELIAALESSNELLIDAQEEINRLENEVETLSTALEDSNNILEESRETIDLLNNRVINLNNTIQQNTELLNRIKDLLGTTELNLNNIDAILESAITYNQFGVGIGFDIISAKAFFIYSPFRNIDLYGGLGYCFFSFDEDLFENTNRFPEIHPFIGGSYRF